MIATRPEGWRRQATERAFPFTATAAERHSLPPAATFLFLKKRNMEKRKRACGRRIKSALRAVCRVRALTRESAAADFVAAAGATEWAR